MRRKVGFAGSVGLSLSLVAGPAMVGCLASYEDWSSTDGALGRINMDDVQLAVERSENAEELEKRLNEIYEGNGLILVRSQIQGEVGTLEVWEDLDGDYTIDDLKDDKLCSVNRLSDGSYELVGHGANQHHHAYFGGGDFLFAYLLLNSVGGPSTGYYYTHPGNGERMWDARATYRRSAAYRSQVQSNRGYAQRQGAFAGSKYRQATGRLSTSRTTYQSVQRSTGAFRTGSVVTRSGAVRSSAGFSSGRSGGFGGGGAFRLRGL